MAPSKSKRPANGPKNPGKAAPPPPPAPEPQEAPERPAAAFPIVGIGASAGGLEALEQFLRHVPQQSGMAFVVVHHMDPTRKDMLVELLQRSTRMPVRQAQDQLRIEADHVYV